MNPPIMSMLGDSPKWFSSPDIKCDNQQSCKNPGSPTTITGRERREIWGGGRRACEVWNTPANQNPQLLNQCCPFKTTPSPPPPLPPPDAFFFSLRSLPHTRSSLNPGARHRAGIDTRAALAEGAGDRASLWNLGNSGILSQKRRPPISPCWSKAITVISSHYLDSSCMWGFFFFKYRIA